MKLSKTLLFSLLAGTLTLHSCKDDETPKFTTGTPTLDASSYSGTGSPVFLYSIDNGATFTTTLPASLEVGTKILVKINNGTEDLSSEDFTFDWSGSTPAPANGNVAVAEFVMPSGALNLEVTLGEVYVIVASHRTTGKFYSVNLANGDTTFAFRATYNGIKLKDTRAFVWHPKEKKFFASTATNSGGDLYSINPATKVATRINENDGANGFEIWDAVVNWEVAADDSLVSVGDFNGDGNGVVKFGTNGGRGKKTIISDVCCGLGAVYGDNKTEFLIANAWDTNSQEIMLQKLNLATGALTGDKLITTFEGFPHTFTTTWLTLKSITKSSDGTLYGLLYNDSNAYTYFVRIDLQASKIIFVRSFGTSGSSQFNTMVSIPKHTF